MEICGRCEKHPRWSLTCWYCAPCMVEMHPSPEGFASKDREEWERMAEQATAFRMADHDEASHGREPRP